MKFKRRRALEVPPKIRSFISSVITTALENIEEPLKGFVWEFDKGDFHHWIELFNHFDSFFTKYINPRRDLRLDDFLEADPPFPREAVLQILRVTRIILENCTNKHFHSSYEQHLLSLLSSTDADVIEGSLQTLTAFLKKTVGKCCIRDASLASKLFTFSQGWGSKEEGLGLIACSVVNECDPVAAEIGSALHFEFYDVGDSSPESPDGKQKSQGLQVIHIPNMHLRKESELELLKILVNEYKVPQNLRFSLLTRLRLAKSFGSLTTRRQYIRIRLYAFIVLVQAGNDADDLASFFANEPEFINELVTLLSYEDSVPEEIRILGVLSLVALCQDRSHQQSVLNAVTSGSQRGILPSLMQKAVDSILSGSAKWSIVFAEALLSLVSVLVSSTPGSLALREVGFIPTILPLLKDTNPKQLHLVGTAVHVLEGFLDFNNNPAAALFRDLGGLDDAISRLKVEISFAVKGLGRSNDNHFNCRGEEGIGSSSKLDMQPLYSEALVCYHRKLLIKALLRTISLAIYVPGNSARIDGSEETLLPTCLSTIFGRAKDFGGGIFSLAANVMVDLVHKDPTCFPVLDAAGVPQAFLDAIMDAVLCSAEVVKCIAPCLDALCLNNTGLQMVKDRNVLMCFVKILTSRTYLRAVGGDTIATLSSGLDELFRHVSSLRASGVDMLVEVLNTISMIGSGSESFPSADSLSYSNPVPMETDQEERSLSPAEQQPRKMASTDQVVGMTSDGMQVTMESFLPECISNAARLLGTILQNSDICRLFIEKRGVETVFKLFMLPLMPASISVGQSISYAFKAFSNQHSAALARALCSFMKDHLKFTNGLLASVDGSKLSDVETAKQSDILRHLSCLEGLLSLSNFLLKGATNIISEFGSSDADIIKELGKVYQEIHWQISLSSDSKVVEKRDATQEAGVGGDFPANNIVGSEIDDDGHIVPLVRYMNPVSVRNTSASHWSAEQDFLSVVRSAERIHRHGRHGLSRTRGSRISRQLDLSYMDSDASFGSLESSLVQDNRKRSPDVLIMEILTKLGFSMRSFFAAVMKGTARRRAEATSLTPVSRILMTALAMLFHDALCYSGNSSAGHMPLSVKCQYLGKVVSDMATLTFDSRRRTCNAALVNSFYVNGTFKELLTTFEATSQLLWNLPYSLPASGPDQGKAVDGCKLSHFSWLLDTLQNYCRLLEHFVNSTLLLSPASPSQTQLLVQPAATGLSLGLFSVPKEPDMFVRLLQSQVLNVILPVWNHPQFPNCTPTLITSVISIVTHIYSGVGDLKRVRTGLSGSTGQRLTGPPALDEATIATIVEMGFTRAQAEEALRSVGTNSVEMATDWLVSHPEELVQEDVQLAQALALSLGNSSEGLRDDGSDKTKHESMEEKGIEPPPIDDILAACMKLFQSNDSVAFPLTDLLTTLCNRNKGEDRPRVTLYLIQELKHCPSDFSKDTGALCPISHLLALLLSEDSSTRETAAENGVISAVLDILANFRVTDESKHEVSVNKTLSSLLLVLDSMLQPIPKVYAESSEGSSGPLPVSSHLDISLDIPTSATEKKLSSNDHSKLTGDVFEKILGKPTGYLSYAESQKALGVACEFIKQHVPALVMQAVLQLCARLTKTHAIATQFLESGGLSALFNLPQNCIFPGFDSIASAIIRHLLEDPQTLQTAMELEIRQTLAGHLSRHAGRLSPRLFLTSMASVISREPVIFMRAAAAVCHLESSGGRITIALKEKEKDREKIKAFPNEGGVPSNEPVRVSENKMNDISGKCSRSHKKVPASLYQVIDQLLEIIMSHPSPAELDEVISFSTPMEIDESATKEKGKSKVDDMKKVDSDGLSERSAWMAKVIFVLKLMSDILLMYVHAVGVVLKRDLETCQVRGSGQAGGAGQGGVVCHILHQVLPLSSKRTTENPDDWKVKLSERASWFLVILCGRSTEGRRRVISEIVKAFSSFSNFYCSSSEGTLLPDKKVLAFADLVNSILSKNSSSNSLPGPGCSPDIAKAMIDGGMVQALSSILRVIDLDHPEVPKVVNLILKALESLTRAANASDQMLKLDGLTKKRSVGSHARMEDHPNAQDMSADHDQTTHHQNEATDTVQAADHQIHESPQNDGDSYSNPSQSMEQDTRAETEENTSATPLADHGVEFMHGMDESGVLPNSNEVGMPFRVERRTDDDMGDEDDEDMGEDDDEGEEEDEDEEDIAEEGAAVMSLADTDLEDRDDHGLGDEYNDDMVDDEDDDFPENRVIEVRWREGLGGLDNLRVLRTARDSSGFIDIASETFQGVNVDDMFHIRRPLSVERRRPNGRASLDRSGLDGNAFQHPLLLRPSLSGESISAILSSSGTSSRDFDALTFGGLDITHLYMFDTGLSSDHTAAPFFGDRFVGGAPPSLINFSVGMDSLHGGRRGPGDSRWTDDGQPQAGSQAAAIAQAIEEQFVSQLRGVISVNNSSQRETGHYAEHSNQQLPLLNPSSQTTVGVNNPSPQQSQGQSQELGASPACQRENSVVEGDLAHPNSLSVDELPAVGAVGDQLPPDSVERFPNDLNVVHDDDDEGMHDGEMPGLSDNVTLDNVTDMDMLSAEHQNVNHPMPDGSLVPANFDGPSGFGSNSNLDALADSGSGIPDPSDGHVSLEQASTDVDMHGTETVDNQIVTSIPASNEEDSSARLSAGVPEDATQADQVNNNEASSTNTIDPTFLEALPEDLRAEVLASQQATRRTQSSQISTYAPPPAEEIDPEFLAALPPDIQAEVLAQQRAQRLVQSEQSEGQPVEMDSASIIATFPPELREEVLLTSSEAVLSGLPSALLAEAQMLRDRAASHYHARSSIFGGSHRLGSRRLDLDRQAVMDRGVGGINRRGFSAISNSLKAKEIEGTPLLDRNALKALIRLLRLAQPPGKGLLQRLLLNLCAHSVTRAILVGLLIDMIRPEADSSSGSATEPLQRLYGCQWNVVYSRPQSLNGLPPIVSRRVLEILTYLATNHSSVADVLFCFDSSLPSESAMSTRSEAKKEKGKGVIEPIESAASVEASGSSEIPLILFLKLLKRPLFLRSNPLIEQVMSLLQVVVNNAVSKVDCQPSNGQVSDHSEALPEKEAPGDVSKGSSTSEPKQSQEIEGKASSDKPPSGVKKTVKPYDILLHLPATDLRNLCGILAHEGLSDKVYSLAADVVKKLAFVATPHRKFFAFELAGLAHSMSSSAVNELVSLRNTQMLGLSAGSMAGTAILRVLQALCVLTSDADGNNSEEFGGELEEQSILSGLNAALEPLWQELSDCISTTEAKLEKSSTFSSPPSGLDNGDFVGASPLLSSPLPPGTQRLLPFIEAFFVLCEKLQTNQATMLPDNTATAREVKETGNSIASPSCSKCYGTGSMTFARIAEKHRRLLNVFIRMNPSLLEKSLSMMLKVPRLIDFDNKRAYFRSRIRQQHDQHHSAPLRISVRRAYILEDSYNQLRMRSAQDLKGRLTVQFQGEEGIDAGGLTREWYQMLSRVIFDKGALLFTTVGNNATFQPNPNSVYQTEHLSYFKFVGRVVAKALFDGQLLDVYFTRSFYKHILGVKVTYHDIEAVDPDYYKNLKWMLENDVSDIPDLTFSMDADEEKHILYEKTEVTDYELIPGGRNIRVTEETKHEYVGLVAGHILTTAIRPQINSFLEGFNELVPRELISIFNDKELELLISGLPEIDLDDLKANSEYTGYTAASNVIQWFWEVVEAFNKEDMARLLQFVTGTSKVPLEGFKALQGISGPQRFQIHKAYGAPERLPSAHTCFNQLDLPEYTSKEQLEERLLLAIHEASEGFGFG